MNLIVFELARIPSCLLSRFFSFPDDWQRCINLKSPKTTCWLFLVDVGKTCMVETKKIRKIIKDFVECPAQCFRCFTSGNVSFRKKKNEIRPHQTASLDQLRSLNSYIF